MAEVVTESNETELPTANEVETARAESRAARLDRLIKKHTVEVPDESEADRTGIERTDPRPEAKKAKAKKLNPAKEPEKKAAPEADAETAKAEPETKGKPPTKDAKPKGEPPVAKKAAPEAEPDDEADEDEEPTEKRAPNLDRARSLLRHGEVNKAITEAFGGIDKELVDDVREALARQLGVNSKQWAQFRQKASEDMRRVRAAQEQVTHLSQQVRQEYGGFVEAKKLYDAGDYAGAIKAAFGDEINDYNRKLIRTHMSADPKVAKLELELEELKREKAVQRKREEEAAQAQHARAEYARYAEQVHASLVDSEDPVIADYATDKDTQFEFTSRVLDILEENYNPATRTTIPVSLAAEQARDEKLAETRKWGKRYGSGAQPTNAETTDRSGDSAKPAARAARSLRHSQAAEANTPVRAMTREERIALYTKRMQQAG